jgi:TetR/AcrR family tetracycline transcriptional repressor
MGTDQPRGKLSRHSVIDAALRLVDLGGLRRLTMRALADELGAPPMTLYTHFAGKEQLRDQLFAGVVERLLATERRPTWQQELETACRHARGVLLAHPHWLPLLARVTVPPPSLHFYDRLLQGMCRDGFAPDAAMHAFSTVLSFTLGEVLVERMMSAHHQPPVPVQQLAFLRELVSKLPSGAFPGVDAALPAFGVWSFDAAFDLGLRSLIRGLEANRETPLHTRRHA